MRSLLLRNEAYTPNALIDAGLAADVVRTLIVDGPRAVPERARESLTGRKRTQPTVHHVWGCDARALLAEVKGQHALQSAGLRLAGKAEIYSESPREGGPR